jgi:hypothetical protein
VCCWEIFTYGEKPFRDLSNRDMIQKLEAGVRLPSPPKCEEDVYLMMQHTWAFDPSARPSFRKLYEYLEVTMELRRTMAEEAEPVFSPRLPQRTSSNSSSTGSPPPGASHRPPSRTASAGLPSPSTNTSFTRDDDAAPPVALARTSSLAGGARPGAPGSEPMVRPRTSSMLASAAAAAAAASTSPLASASRTEAPPPLPPSRLASNNVRLGAIADFRKVVVDAAQEKRDEQEKIRALTDRIVGCQSQIKRLSADAFEVVQRMSEEMRSADADVDGRLKLVVSAMKAVLEAGVDMADTPTMQEEVCQSIEKVVSVMRHDLGTVIERCERIVTPKADDKYAAQAADVTKALYVMMQNLKMFTSLVDSIRVVPPPGS